MDLSPVEEEVEERGVVDGLDLGPAPVVPWPVPYRPLRLRRSRRRRGRRGRRERRRRRERRAEAGAEAAREQHLGRAG
uniref:Biotin synthase n=1 Tax=Arundo donax TaxID=35708 RepID=A0A0A9G479_ARUDO